MLVWCFIDIELNTYSFFSLAIFFSHLGVNNHFFQDSDFCIGLKAWTQALPSFSPEDRPIYNFERHFTDRLMISRWFHAPTYFCSLSIVINCSLSLLMMPVYLKVYDANTSNCIVTLFIRKKLPWRGGQWRPKPAPDSLSGQARGLFLGRSYGVQGNSPPTLASTPPPLGMYQRLPQLAPQTESLFLCPHLMPACQSPHFLRHKWHLS